MLVLSRKIGERVQIGNNITLVVKSVSGHRVTLGLEVPRSVRILRSELEPFPAATNPSPLPAPGIDRRDSICSPRPR
jgi:carbon storage regulator CsrA